MTDETNTQDPTNADDATQSPTTDENGGETPATFEAWLEAQDETGRELVTSHTAGLRSALDSERTERKALAKQLRELTAKADEGSELRSQLDALNADFESTQRKATFYESAPGTVANLRLAWLAANDLNLVDSGGDVDWSKLQQQAPELFRRPSATPGNAGNGTATPPIAKPSMNDFIRAASGRS